MFDFDTLADTAAKVIKERIKAEMRKAVVDFLKEEGFEIGDDVIGSVIAIQEELNRGNRTIKCEYFIKLNDDLCGFSGLCIPYIDALDKPMTRAELYSIYRLQEQGYSYKWEKVWL